MSRVVTEKLELTVMSHRCQEVHIFLRHMMENRQTKVKTLIQGFCSARHVDVISSDEKCFTVEATLNHQNGRSQRSEEDP